MQHKQFSGEPQRALKTHSAKSTSQASSNAVPSELDYLQNVKKIKMKKKNSLKPT